METRWRFGGNLRGSLEDTIIKISSNKIILKTAIKMEEVANQNEFDDFAFFHSKSWANRKSWISFKQEMMRIKNFWRHGSVKAEFATKPYFRDFSPVKSELSKRIQLHIYNDRTVDCKWRNLFAWKGINDFELPRGDRFSPASISIHVVLYIIVSCGIAAPEKQQHS